MDKPKSNIDFKFMSLIYKFRNLFLPRKKILKEVGIKPGFHVLDYGCGPGSYIIPLAELVGESGKIYALDIHPLAIQRVQSIASKKQLTNVFTSFTDGFAFRFASLTDAFGLRETICSDCKTGLPDNSVDVILLYDTFHNLGDPNGVLEELYRVLKPNGILSFSDHHMKENEPNFSFKKKSRSCVARNEAITKQSIKRNKEEFINEIVSKVTSGGLYKLSRKGEKTYSFLKERKRK